MKRWSLALLSLMLGLGIGSALVGSWLHGQNPQSAPTAGALPRDLSSYRDVVKQVLPAVVSIETHSKNKTVLTRTNPQFFDDPSMPEEFRRFFDESGRNPTPPSTPSRLGFGSGFFIDPSGVVVTNFHVVDGADSAVVHLQDGRTFNSRNIRVDRRTDLAVILLDTKAGTFPTLSFGDSDAMEIGDRVLAVGAPFGLAGSVTQGIVSAKGRNGLHMNMYEDFIQTDAAINPGNSGGPLVNLEGKVVGINAAIKSRTGGFQGVGLAVASNLAKNVVQSLRTTGSVHRGYLGVQVRELDRSVADRLGVPKDTGVVVAEVFDKTPAAKAGVKAGDVITGIAGKAVKSGQELQHVVAALAINQAAAVDVVRDGKTEHLSVTIEEQPNEYGTAGAPAPRSSNHSAPNAVTLDKLGIDVADLTSGLADNLGYRKGVQGVVVTRVHDNGLAIDTGLRKGTLITKIDDRRVTDVASARQALENANLARGIVLQIATPQGGVNYVFLRSANAGT